ncbi:MAG: hypothetical protein ACXV4A_05840 [Actinomycetes bacterium]
MTAILILLVLAVAVDLVATMRTLRHDKPREVPASHPEWSGRGLPSHPYTA